MKGRKSWRFEDYPVKVEEKMADAGSNILWEGNTRFDTVAVQLSLYQTEWRVREQVLKVRQRGQCLDQQWTVPVQHGQLAVIGCIFSRNERCVCDQR